MIVSITCCFPQIYSNNEALTPNPRSPLEDYSLHLVDLRAGRLCDTRHFKVDKIYLSHNQGDWYQFVLVLKFEQLAFSTGLYLYKDILAVLSVQHQTIHIFQILDGMFINVRTIGRYQNPEWNWRWFRTWISNWFQILFGGRRLRSDQRLAHDALKSVQRFYD